MTEIFKWLDKIFQQLEENIAEYKKLRQALIDDPTFDDSDSEAALKKIKEALGDGD